MIVMPEPAAIRSLIASATGLPRHRFSAYVGLPGPANTQSDERIAATPARACGLAGSGRSASLTTATSSPTLRAK